ncbi:hypothetical protein [Cupriavidus numazuensis]|uniref:Uncharacterized protein n=1 Tax=Cupriavidus numazuensis TaxID=221992 RepID=A0ABN7QDN4_9BURK|nr:hypothetical protein [Cupriavidus numazuensis]CAG2158161.1 hypothetical protein LMG26411_05858 [Cupriavidus numazuensis]
MTSPSLQLALAAQHVGVYFTPVSTCSTTEELAHFATGSGSGVPALSATKAEAPPTLDALIEDRVHPMACGEDLEGYPSWGAAAAVCTDTPLTDPISGEVLLHSSHSAGKPKGIVRPAASSEFNAFDQRHALAMKPAVSGTPTATSVNKSKQYTTLSARGIRGLCWCRR